MVCSGVVVDVDDNVALLSTLRQCIKWTFAENWRQKLQNLMFSTAIIQCISIFHFKWNKIFVISSAVFTSLRLFMELRNVLFSAFFLNVAIPRLIVYLHTHRTFIWFLQHLKLSFVNFVIFRGDFCIEWPVWLMNERHRKKEKRSQARIECPMRWVHTHTNIESHNMKTIEQQMQNIQQLIPHKLSSFVAWRVRTMRQRDSPTRQKFCIVYKRWTLSISVRTCNKMRWMRTEITATAAMAGK